MYAPSPSRPKKVVVWPVEGLFGTLLNCSDRRFDFLGDIRVVTMAVRQPDSLYRNQNLLIYMRYWS